MLTFARHCAVRLPCDCQVRNAGGWLMCITKVLTEMNANLMEWGKIEAVAKRKIVQNNDIRGVTYPSSFSGTDVVAFLEANGFAESTKEALELAEALHSNSVFHDVLDEYPYFCPGPTVLYRFKSSEHWRKPAGMFEACPGTKLAFCEYYTELARLIGAWRSAAGAGAGAGV